MANEEKTIIEVNGVKLEVDLRTARVVDSYRIRKIFREEKERTNG
jgi:hypothetical protein